MMEDLQQQFSQNHVIYDRYGIGSVMVYVERFYLDDVIDGVPHVLHPAFIVNGREIRGIYISKYQNVLIDGRAYSLRDRDPATSLSFDAAVEACRVKGDGFHLMTAMEWGAIALWCRKHGCLPLGNNGMGKDVRETEQIARISYRNEEKQICRVATGTGPLSWSHNRRADGIWDLNGNVWEWVGGMRLVYGEVQVLPDNNAASPGAVQDAPSIDWRAIDGRNGEWILPDGHGTTENSVKLDYRNGSWCYVTGEISDALLHYRCCDFSAVTAHPSVSPFARMLLYALALLPNVGGADCDGVEFYANNGAAERMPFRGGRWGQGKNAGVLKACLDDPRTFAGEAVGFRSAYYTEE